MSKDYHVTLPQLLVLRAHRAGRNIYERIPGQGAKQTGVKDF